MTGLATKTKNREALITADSQSVTWFSAQMSVHKVDNIFKPLTPKPGHLVTTHHSTLALHSQQWFAAILIFKISYIEPLIANGHFIYWRKEVIQHQLSLCEKLIAPLVTYSTNEPNWIWVQLDKTQSGLTTASPAESTHGCNRSFPAVWRCLKGLNSMQRSKEIPEETRKKVIKIYQSGNGYTAVAEALGPQWTTAIAIISKWRELGRW